MEARGDDIIELSVNYFSGDWWVRETFTVECVGRLFRQEQKSFGQRKGEEKTQENRNKVAVIQVGKTRACPETGAAARPLGAEKGSWKETLVMPSFAVSAAMSSAVSFLGFLQSHSALSHI